MGGYFGSPATSLTTGLAHLPNVLRLFSGQLLFYIHPV